MALLLGLIFVLVMGNSDKQKTNQWGGYLLKISVIGLGFGINIGVLLKAGKQNLGSTTFFVFFALIVGFLVGKLLKIDKKISLLISVGTAICGGSAIAAVSPVLKANSNQIAISTGVVFLLNAVALFTFPTVGHWLGLSQAQFGTWAAIAIHDMSSVVGAASNYGDVALNIASVTKMLRVLWIIPISLILVFGFSENRESFKIPIFIVGFVVASCLFSFVPAFKNLYHACYIFSKQAMIVSLFFIGSSISLESIKQVGGRVILQAAALWVIICLVSLLFVIKYQP